MLKDEKKALITGANGQLGQEIIKEFKKKFVVIPTDTYNLDITNKKEVETFFTKEKPDVIVHCAAWTNVDAAAEDPEGAMKVNGEGTKNLCEAAKKIGAKVIYISTNEVFDGKKGSSYIESDETGSTTPYGRSKLAGEKYCQEILGESCIVTRTSWLYSPGSGVNFPNKIIKKAWEQGFLKVVDDEISTPTYAPDLARAIKKLTEKNPTGIFHLVNEGQASRYNWAKLVLKLTHLENIYIEPIKLKDFERPSKPPEHCVLKNDRAAKLGIKLRDWKDACTEYVERSSLSSYNRKITYRVGVKRRRKRSYLNRKAQYARVPK